MSRTAFAVLRVLAITGLLLANLVGFADAPVSAAPSTAERDAFCAAWAQISANPTADTVINLGNGVTARAATLRLSGAACDAKDAKIGLAGATLQTNPTAAISARSALARAATVPASGQNLGAGSEPAPGIRLTWLNLEWNPWDGFVVSGGIDISLQGATTSVLFRGTLRDLQNWSLTLASPTGGTSIAGFPGSNLDFHGTLVSNNGQISFSLTASVASVRFGDLEVRNGTLDFAFDTSANPTIHAALTGTIVIGTTGSASANFDVLFANGAFAKITGNANLDWTVPTGRVAGNLAINYANGGAATMSFDGSITTAQGNDRITATAKGSLTAAGTLTASASGNVVLQGYALSFSGNVTYTSATSTLVVTGSGGIASPKGGISFNASGSLNVTMTPARTDYAFAGKGTIYLGILPFGGSFSLTSTAKGLIVDASLRVVLISFGARVYLTTAGKITQMDLHVGFFTYLLVALPTTILCGCKVTRG